MGLPLKKEDQVYTYADYLTWSNDERWELIDGAAYNMSPAPNRRHQEIVGEIFRKLANFLADKPCRVYVSPFDVRMSEAGIHARNDEIRNVVQPDVSVYCTDEQLDDAGAVLPPDIAVEVLSPYTSLKDQREKLRLYERFSVKEYWIVDPQNNILYLYRLKESGDYGKPEAFGPEDTLTSIVLEDFELSLAPIFED